MTSYDPAGARRDPEPPFGGPSSTPPTPDGATAGWGAPPTPAAGPARPVLLLQAVGAAVLGAVVWALLLDFANLELSLIAAATGSVVGSLLGRALGRGVAAAVVAGLLTAASSLAGEVVGTWLHVARQQDVPFGLVRSRISVQLILQNIGAIAWIFVLVGVVLAVLAGIGRYDRFGAGRRRPGGFAGRF